MRRLFCSQHRLITLGRHYRLSNENVSSVYDDRLDKIDPEGTLVPGQRRYYIVHEIKMVT